MKLLARVRVGLVFPAAKALMKAQSGINWLKSLNKPDRVVFEREYDGQNIILFALYENGSLRLDVELFLQVAKARNIYVICINTLRLSDPDAYSDLIDCYIERYNYGRDFGSYQSGFRYIYKRRLEETCPRLLMVNDSVYFSCKHTDNFLRELFESDREVLGATENHEIEHHLGSFCIAFSSSILRNHKFQDYWRSYKNTDVRPVVIKRGEMGLSKVLRRIAKSPDHFCALYDVARAARVLEHNASLISELKPLSRSSGRVDWPCYSTSTVVKNITKRYLYNTYNLVGVWNDELVLKEFSDFKLGFVLTIGALADFIFRNIQDANYDDIYNVIEVEMISHFLECFSRGSQIHQNNIFLHYIGLPIIKLDGLYRGMFSARDIQKLSQDIDESQAEDFRRIMYSRPFGGDVLFGWKLAAFYRGLI